MSIRGRPPKPKFESGADARDAFQIFYEKGNPKSWSDARLRGTFDTLQLFDGEGRAKVKVPLENGGKGPGLEPFTSAYPEYGRGGEAQLLPTEKTAVKFDDVDFLPE